MSWRFHTQTTLNLSRWNLRRCDGCGRCSAACPVAEAMDFPPSAVVEMALDGQCDRLTRLSAPWVCTDCRACSDLCPQGVAVASFLGTLRQECHLEQRIEDVPVNVEAIAGFHQAFTTTCRASGRAGHWATFLRYRLGTLDFFTNLDLGLRWLLAGRLRLRPRVPSLTISRMAKRVIALHKQEEEAAQEAADSANKLPVEGKPEAPSPAKETESTEPGPPPEPGEPPAPIPATDEPPAPIDDEEEENRA